jgi:hypothetical protein
VLDAHGIACSMSRRGDCYDNAVLEAFFSSVKSELADRFESCGDAKMELFDYSEVFYNQRRRHSTLGYTSPAEFERRAAVDAAGAVDGRVEEWRGGVQGRRRQTRATPFVAALAEKPIAPFPLPAHRTGRDHLGHPALGRVSRAGIRGRDRGDASKQNTPSSPNNRASGNCR